MSGMNGLSKGQYEVVEAKTADYYIKVGDIGKIFTNRGAAGAVILYLPDVDEKDLEPGWNISVFVVADQSLTVNATVGTDDEIVAFNDAAADSVGFATASMKIGNGLKIVFDGTSWLAFMNLGAAEASTTDIPTIVS